MLHRTIKILVDCDAELYVTLTFVLGLVFIAPGLFAESAVDPDSSLIRYMLASCWV